MIVNLSSWATSMYLYFKNLTAVTLLSLQTGTFLISLFILKFQMLTVPSFEVEQNTSSFSLSSVFTRSLCMSWKTLTVDSLSDWRTSHILTDLYSPLRDKKVDYVRLQISVMPESSVNVRTRLPSPEDVLMSNSLTQQSVLPASNWSPELLDVPPDLRGAIQVIAPLYPAIKVKLSSRGACWSEEPPTLKHLIDLPYPATASISILFK